MELEQIVPIFKENFIPIVLTVNDAYMPYLSVCLESLVEHSNNNINYDLMIFGKDLSDNNKKIINNQFQYPNISLRFIDIYEVIVDYNLKASGRFPVEVYFRIICTLMLKYYKKVIFIDADLVLEDDISKLYSIEFENAVCACRDTFVFIEHDKNRLNKSFHLNYIRNVLKFSFNETKNYVNAGVLVINLEYWRQNDIANEMLTHATNKLYRMQDQDIINIVLKDNITFLDPKWNFLAMPVICDRIPNSDYKDILCEAMDKPSIVHYAGPIKPWNGIRFDCLQERWWFYARKTPYYEIFLRNICLQDIKKQFIDLNQGISTEYIHQNCITATDRIQNYLSYKLGRLMIENSKSIFGWIKMPFSIISTIKEHKLLTKLTNKITKLPKIETLPDYKEALKYKNHMSYKLGEALLKGLKTWYKGGLIKFIFEAIKINKSKNKVQ